jgi:hypothetical protein
LHDDEAQENTEAKSKANLTEHKPEENTLILIKTRGGHKKFKKQLRSCLDQGSVKFCQNIFYLSGDLVPLNLYLLYLFNHCNDWRSRHYNNTVFPSLDKKLQ